MSISDRSFEPRVSSPEITKPPLDKDQVRALLDRIATASWTARETGTDPRTEVEISSDYAEISRLDREYRQDFSHLKRDIFDQALTEGEGADPQVGLLQNALFFRLVESARASAKELSTLSKDAAETDARAIRSRYSAEMQTILDATHARIGKEKTEVVLGRFDEIVASEKISGALSLRREFDAA